MRLRFHYTTQLPIELCDTYTHSAAMDLMLRGIHTIQMDTCTLNFETLKDLTYAVLLLSASSVYTVSVEL
jgi:hypothetical protein